MTATTNGHASPGLAGACDAAPKGLTGWTDPGIDEIIANPNLTAAAKLVAVCLIRQWAWFKDSCFPSDQTIASKIGMSPGHVQRCLGELEQAGYIRRERTPRCRIIWLLWRLGEAPPTPAQSDTRPVAQSPSRPVAQSPSRPIRAGAQSPSRPVRAGAQSPILLGAQSGCAPALTEPVVSEPDVETRYVERNATSTSLPSIPDTAKNGHTTPLVASPPAPPLTGPALTPAPASGTCAIPDRTSDIPTVRPILEELKTIHGADAGRVRVVANRLAAWLLDVASLGYYIAVLAKAAAGMVPVEALVAAFQAATRSKESARRPGAIWVWTLNNWVKPPLPSQINQPVYCASIQSPEVCDPAAPSPAPPVDTQSGDELSPDEEIALWKQWSENKSHPFHYLAQQRMARLDGQAPTL